MRRAPRREGRLTNPVDRHLNFLTLYDPLRSPSKHKSHFAAKALYIKL